MFAQALKRLLTVVPARVSPLTLAALVVGATLMLFCALSALSSTYLVTEFKPALPFARQVADGSIQAEVFASSQPIQMRHPTAYLLGGRLATLQALSAEKTGFMLALLAAAAALAGTLLTATRWRLARWGFMAATSALSIFWSIRVSGGWDEYFINLKHAFNLAHHFTFSANVQSNLEATVDFAPFAIAAALSRLFSLDLADAGIAVSLVGNVLCIAAAYALVRRLAGGAETPGVIAGVVAGLFPAIINVGGTGFMSGLFAGLVLVSAHWLIALRGRWSARAIALLGLLTLFRTEAVLLALLVALALAARFGVQALQMRTTARTRRKAFRIIAWRFLIVLAPFIISALVRLAVFGEPVPVPVVFKSVGADMSYLRNGIGYFLTCMQIFRIDLLFAVAGIPLVLYILKIGSRALLFCASLLLFSLAYVTGGGDWFPYTWARYLTPLLLTTVVLAVSMVFAATAPLTPKARPPVFLATIAMAIVLLFGAGASSNAYRELWSDWPKNLNRWQRVDNLSSYGDFLRQTLPPTAVIASPEDASLMYHAERDMIDVLGIANAAIAHSRLDPVGPGDLMHRRRNIDVIRRERPDIIALWEMSFLLGPEFPVSDPEAVRSFVQVFPLSQVQLDTSFYRVGSYGYLQSLGYRAVAVAQPGHLFFYWVHSKVFDQHVAAMGAVGFHRTGTVALNYQYSSAYTDRFFGGLPYVAASVQDTVPVGSALLPLTIARSDAAWGKEALPRPFVEPTPESVGLAYASWNGADTNTGRLLLGPYPAPGASESLAVPVLRGPDAGGQIITIRDADTGDILFRKALTLPAEHKWFWLSMDLRIMGNVKNVTIEAADEGAGWGQWSALGSPRIVTPSRNDERHD